MDVGWRAVRTDRLGRGLRLRASPGVVGTMTEQPVATVTPPQAEPQRSSLDLAEMLKYIGSPLAIGTALLFYFGWVRSNEQAELLGADISVFEMSPDDFVLRSVNVVFIALLVLLLL